MNKVILIGNLGRDPEVKYISNGTAVANFALATVERWKDNQGKKQERIDWHRAVAWGRTAEITGEYLSKGSKVCIEGKLQTRTWDDNGTTRYITEVIVSSLEMLSGNGRSSKPPIPKSSSRSAAHRTPEGESLDAHYTPPGEDGIPF